jgi:division protein 1
LVESLYGHEGLVSCVDVDQERRTVLTGSADRTLRQWTYGSKNNNVRVLEGHAGMVTCLQMQGDTAISGSSDCTLRYWRLSEQDTPTQPQRRHGDASSSDDDSEDEAYRPPSTPAHQRQEDAVVLSGHAGAVTCLHYNDDLLVSGSSDRTIKQWDLNTGACTFTIDVNWTIQGTASHTHLYDGAFIGALQFYQFALASGTADGILRMWDLRTGQPHRALTGHTGAITCLGFDQMNLVSGSTDGTIRIWDIRSGEVYDSIHVGTPIHAIEFDQLRVFGAMDSDESLYIYDRLAFSGSRFPAHREPIRSMRLDGHTLVTGASDNVVKVWNV